MSAPAASASRSLYRSLLRAGKGFTNYNFRDYAIRTVKDDFRIGAAHTGAEADAAYRQGRVQLDMLRRQSTISQLFPQEKHSME